MFTVLCKHAYIWDIDYTNCVYWATTYLRIYRKKHCSLNALAQIV